MADRERNNLISTWGYKALQNRFKVNPYSLTQEELESLKSFDELDAKIQRLIKDILVQTALNNSFRYKL